MKKIQLTSGDIALIDDLDFDLVDKYKWCLKTNIWSDNKYATSTTKPYISMHRLLMPSIRGQYVDHINHNGLDNRRKNLRIVSARENQLNLKKKSIRI